MSPSVVGCVRQLRRSSLERETLRSRAARVNEEKKESKGGVPRRDSKSALCFGTRRTRHRGFVGEGTILEQSGEDEEGKEKVDDA